MNRPLSCRPNVVFILTDDQDLHMDSLDYMPLLKKHMRDQGTFYKRHFTTTAICCPARVTLWTGKAAHNTNVTDLAAPYGGYPKFVEEGLNENYLPIWLQSEGYNTYYAGKLFNAHTVNNYDQPFVKGWNESDFLLDPYVYMYLNSTFQRNREAPVSHEGEYVTDVLAAKTQGFLESALEAENERPFFLAVAPNAPHSNVDASFAKINFTDVPRNWSFKLTTPVPAARHAHLFADAIVPRRANFNPERASGANWVRQQPRLSDDNVAWNDDFYRNRLRALQAVDELIDDVFARLEAAGVRDHTYVVFTTDNGFHISQHRLQPGKECSFEEDINIPLIIRGPGIPKGAVSEAVTTHSDLAPTILSIIGAPLRADFDGIVVPLTQKQQEAAVQTRHEHVAVEFWGMAGSEGKARPTSCATTRTKAIRVIGPRYNLHYVVWCNNEHELYDLQADPHQVTNLLHPDEAASRPATLLGHPLDSVVARLDALLLVAKSCKGRTCTQPWHALHPQGDVGTLHEALAPQFDAFYLKQQPRVRFEWCAPAQLLAAEGPQFEKDGVAFWNSDWSLWT
ncbi:alkaline-phosphatase-like protein [Microdochium trichocladiopsis]|uniref:Arylsulfatase n=1 Tax=Microdochium trichocladiopsis TaxID=1682393 RepID=A0A9P8Y520_9PEZI|nr:alkaline-phosphatase-like protein [Microdochium trichocladiopsis]KAH7029821.1 alkaline-phosphatase-like protein [Microdochium trichocladiopsis]